MQTHPFISFLVPVYNVPNDLLTECLQSIFALSLSAHEREVIVVDDGSSTDITASWSAEWREQIRLIRQSNQGASIARNAALEAASGEYVQFVDSDDYLFADIYNSIITLLREQPHIELCSFYGTSDLRVRRNEITPLARIQSGVEYLEHNNLRVAPWCYAVKRSLVSTLRFVPHTLYEDVEFTARLFLAAQSVYTTAATPYYYRVRQGSLTRSITADYKERNLPMNETILYRLHNLQVPASSSKALERCLSHFTMDYVYTIMSRTHDYRYLQATIKRLRAHGLYPFPNKHYSIKYSLFRYLVAFPLTRWALTYVLR